MLNEPNGVPLNSLRGRRTLVVDDVDAERQLLATWLQRQGCRVYAGVDGDDACRKVLAVMPELVLMDENMPGSDGLQACRRLRADARTRHIPVIFLTGAAEPEARAAGLLAGAVDYITKPYDFDEVRLRLSIHLSPAAAPAEAPAQAPALPEVSAAVWDGAHPDDQLFNSARALLVGPGAGLAHDLPTLAQRLGTHPLRLEQAFRACVGVGIGEYLREERLKQARSLLADTALDLQTLALQLGFASQSHFVSSFYERFGATPQQFRQVSPDLGRSGGP